MQKLNLQVMYGNVLNLIDSSQREDLDEIIGKVTHDDYACNRDFSVFPTNSLV